MNKLSLPAVKLSLITVSALFLTGCQQSKMISHTTHNERTTEAKSATEILSKRYQELKIQETNIAPLNCAIVAKADKKADKIINRLQANAVHPHDGQSVMHIPTHLEMHEAEKNLDALSSAIEECRLSHKKENAPL